MKRIGLFLLMSILLVGLLPGTAVLAETAGTPATSFQIESCDSAESYTPENYIGADALEGSGALFVTTSAPVANDCWMWIRNTKPLKKIQIPYTLADAENLAVTFFLYISEVQDLMYDASEGLSGENTWLFDLFCYDKVYEDNFYRWDLLSLLNSGDLSLQNGWNAVILELDAATIKPTDFDFSQIAYVDLVARHMREGREIGMDDIRIVDKRVPENVSGKVVRDYYHIDNCETSDVLEGFKRDGSEYLEGTASLSFTATEEDPDALLENSVPFAPVQTGFTRENASVVFGIYFKDAADFNFSEGNFLVVLTDGNGNSFATDFGALLESES